MTRRSSRQQLTPAYHEAGHTVAALMLGYPVRSVSIVPNDYSQGRLDWDSPLGDPSLEFGNVDKVKHLIEHAIIVMRAGSMAQRRHNPRRWRYGLTGARRGEPPGEGSDEQGIQEQINRLYRDRKVAKAFRQYLESRTEALVNANWARIGRLARALHKQQMLEGDAIERAMLSPRELALRGARLDGSLTPSDLVAKLGHRPR